ncbi:putative pentatricopeptide repeat-containing protein [Hirschfeldia incana]|nr:putative pentatricopeptide repeat-containing protein [Hirschfeldia incana]
MLLRSPARHVAFQLLLPLLPPPRRLFSDASRALRRELRSAGHKRIPPELIERVSRLLILGRYDALHSLSLDFSDRLLNSLLRTSRLHPEACLEVFNLASKQQTFRPDYKSYCKMVHILSRARMYDQTRAYLSDLIGLNHSCFVVWDELVRVYKSFRFSPTVFDMVLKVYAEKGLVKEALHVFDNMGGRVPSLLSCNSLLSCLVKKGECFVALRVYDQMVSLGVSPDVFTCSIVVNAYCKSGEVERGVEFAERMEMEMNVVTFNSLVNGYAVSGDVEGVRRVLGMMSERGVCWNVVTYTLLIKCYCRKGLMEEAEKVFESVKKEEKDQRVYGVLIDGYCRCGKVSDAVRVHDEMLRKGVRTNATIVNSLINGYCKAGQLVEAERMFMRMKDWSLKPDHYTYNTLVDGYCRAGRVNEALKLCDRLSDVPTVMTYNTLLKGFTRVGAYHEVVSLWKTMVKRGVCGNEISCSTLLEALFKLGDFDEAMTLWKNVLARGLLTDTVTLNVMISGLCKMEKVSEAKEILDSVRCKPDVRTYQALSHGYYRVGDFKEAFGVKDYMESKGMFPTIEMYNTLISAAFKCRYLNKVTDLVNELRARGLTPTVATYGALITGWCNIGAMDKAYAACFEMIEKGIDVNVNICSKIATSLFRLDKIEEACLLLGKLVDFDLLLPGYQSFKEFLSPCATTCVETQKIADSVESITTLKKVLVPNNIVYNVALAGLCKAGKLKEARKLFSELILREGFSPDEYTYTILIHGCAVDGEVNEAFNLRDEMAVKGITPNVVTYNALIKGLCKSGNLDRAQRLLRKLPQKGVTPNAITYKTLIDGLMKCGRLDEAVRLKDIMVEKGLVRGGSYKQGDGEKVNEVLDIKSGIAREMEEDSDDVYDVRIVSGV